MHSSVMHTAHLLIISQHALRRGRYLPGGCTCLGVGVYLPGGVCPGVCIPACNGTDTPHGQTDTCENITFANFVCRA